MAWLGDQKLLQIKVAARAEKGKANIALVKLLSKVLSVPKKSIKILSGHTNQLKILSIANIESDALYLTINKYLNSPDKN